MYTAHGQTDSFDIVCAGEHQSAFWIEASKIRVEFFSILFGELGAERVEGDVNGSPIRFKGKHFGHDFRGRGVFEVWVFGDESVKVFKVVFV